MSSSCETAENKDRQEEKREKAKRDRSQEDGSRFGSGSGWLCRSKKFVLRQMICH